MKPDESDKLGTPKILPVARVFPNPDQPRKLFPVVELQELAASIEMHGLLQPVRVRAAGEAGWMLICGERRWRAHQLLGWKSILAVVVERSMLHDDGLADAAIVENLQRADISALEEARAYQRRLDAGVSVDELAVRLGLKTPARIRQRLLLLNLLPELQDALARGILFPIQAYAMGRLGPASQRVFFRAVGDGRARNADEINRLAAALLAAEKQENLFAGGPPPPSREDVAGVRALERKIAQVEAIVGAGFRDNEIVILQKVNPLNADVLADRLEVIEKALKSLRLALRAAKASAARRATG